VRRLLFAPLLFLAATASAQEPLVTDRPDFTESVNVVDRGRFQLEGGATFTRSDETDELALGELLLRVGVAPRLELRLAANSFLWIDGPQGNDDGVEDAVIGGKVLLVQDAAALLFGTSVPTGSDGLSSDAWEPELKLAVARGVGEASVGANVGWIWTGGGDERRHRGLASITAGFPMGQGGVFVETYGIATEGAGGEEAYADAGLTRLLSDDFQLDVRIGVGVGGDAADWFFGMGAARRW
jgi:hypothetical protein